MNGEFCMNSLLSGITYILNYKFIYSIILLYNLILNNIIHALYYFHNSCFFICHMLFILFVFVIYHLQIPCLRHPHL